MVILLDADLADITVIASAGNEVFALKAHLFDVFLTFLFNQFRIIFGLFHGGSIKQREV